MVKGKERNDIENDHNYIAFTQAEKSGGHEKLQPGTWVVYSGGVLVGTGLDKEKLFKDLDKQGIHGGYAKQVEVPERVVDVPTIFFEK